MWCHHLAGGEVLEEVILEYCLFDDCPGPKKSFSSIASLMIVRDLKSHS